MKIGDLSRLTSTRVETIRFYEKEGLIPPPGRTHSNYRVYETSHLNRLSFIRRSRDLGFTLDEVRKLLALADDREAPCADVDALAAEHIKEIDKKVRDLMALRDQLARKLSDCDGASIAECRIIEALAPAPDLAA
ncbi:MerR family transcriptional regulator [Sphingomonas oryzagri]|uniref:Helix-turn-helix domain-containing protein n=1 Tax=Sphingomonas oryzagri TaxID=3042314 RepID=A0ABT6N582_9SPHN|nr:helix-turn-helix domain-containing protein [Sphingomonas oryzagri]MDH7640266.1 helix-turn-helix domain-containing protein [Sphingomonas oryzagri]